MIDIFVTVKDRYELACRSLRSLFECTDRSKYRLTLCVDGDDDRAMPEFHELQREADYVLRSTRNEGLGPTINRALGHIEGINRWYADPKAGDPSKVTDLICMCQDDLLFRPGWLETLSEGFYRMEGSMKLGFASGVECVEHPITKGAVGRYVFKDWVRAAQMLGRREYWMSMWPIPRFDPETGNVRARPHDGIGSGVDWHFIRNHPNSVCRTGRTNLVIPGLIRHMGYDRSTWLKREMPESEEDKRSMEGMR